MRKKIPVSEIFIEDENMLSPSDSADYQMLKKELVNALDTLTDRERKVIELRFGLIDGQARTFGRGWQGILRLRVNVFVRLRRKRCAS